MTHTSKPRLTPAEASRVRQEVVTRLKILLAEVPGTKTSWDEIVRVLARRVPVETLAALAYRIEAARAQSYDEGRVAGAVTGRETP